MDCCGESVAEALAAVLNAAAVLVRLPLLQVCLAEQDLLLVSADQLACLSWKWLRGDGADVCLRIQQAVKSPAKDNDAHAGTAMLSRLS